MSIKVISRKYVDSRSARGFLFTPRRLKNGKWAWEKGEHVTTRHGYHSNILWEKMEEAAAELGCPIKAVSHNDPVTEDEVRELILEGIEDPAYFATLPVEEQELITEMLAPLFA